MNSLEIKNASLEKLRETLKDCDDTIAFVKKRKWIVGLTITKESYEENTNFAIATCEELKRNIRSQIKKRLKVEREKKDRG